MTDPTPLDPLERLDRSLNAPRCEANSACQIFATDYARLACGHGFYVCRMHRVEVDVALAGGDVGIGCARDEGPRVTTSTELAWVEL